MSEQVRIVRRGKKGHKGHHGGAWKVAYADFVTAMMAFFLVMWIIGLDSAVKEAIAGYFQDPVAFMQAVQQGDKPFSVNTVSAPEIKPDMAVDSLKLAEERHEQKKKFEEVKTSLEKLIAEYPEFKDLVHSIRVEVALEGLRIDLIESSSDLFFDSGSATTKPRTRELLGRMASELGSLPNKVIIEGHTDSRPYHGPHGWTNWELSTARANAARAVMESSGLRDGQMIEVRGLADTMPIEPDRKDSFRNRRVSILLPFQMSLREPAPPELVKKIMGDKPGSSQESTKTQDATKTASP